MTLKEQWMKIFEAIVSILTFKITGIPIILWIAIIIGIGILWNKLKRD